METGRPAGTELHYALSHLPGALFCLRALHDSTHMAGLRHKVSQGDSLQTCGSET